VEITYIHIKVAKLILFSIFTVRIKNWIKESAAKNVEVDLDS
jgi:ABC-type transport system involved in Fe-S cluster assembly fused permease/ATPase subunit